MDKSIGENIRKLRLNKKLTQKELAQKCNISLSALNKYERGERIPKIENISSIASALGVSSLEIIKPSKVLDISEQITFTSLSSDEQDLIKEMCTKKTIFLLKFLDMDNFNLSCLSIKDIRQLQKKVIETSENFFHNLKNETE